MKNHRFLEGISPLVSLESTLSDQGMSFITFLIENILVTFPTPILNHVFWSFSLIFTRFCLHYHAILSHNGKFASKKHEKINEIEQKTRFKIGVGKVMKIFSIGNARNHIPWSLKVLSRDARGDIPLKNHDFFIFFHPIRLLKGFT